MTMLRLIGHKVDQYNYNDIMNSSTNLLSIWSMIELVYNIGHKRIHFLELNKIVYEKSESQSKFYKKVYHHFMDNLYKTGDTLKYKSCVLQSAISNYSKLYLVLHNKQHRHEAYEPDQG